MRITLDIPDNKAEFFMELVQSLNFTHVADDEDYVSLNVVKADLAIALEEVKQYEQGKVKLPLMADFLNEL